jgi:DNA mismatch repair protein MutL
MSDIKVTNDATKDADNRPIKILPPQLANQIAAGEVVERPASVVKELVENSLDAGATQIHIDIEQGGQKRILVRDDGRGISKDQLTLALSRHATSKIGSIDDLEHITSMGFRGEALASISSVSRLTLTSKPASQSEAWQAQAEGQQMEVELKPAAHPDGTSIDVVDLFFNTPARRKFLRTGKTEFQHIEQIIKRIALTRPDVQFVLSHNQKVSCRYTSVSSFSKRIEQVCGKNMLANCAPVDYTFEDISLTGWCSKLGMGSANRDLQYTFVNGRMMKDKLLSHALRQVYEDTLPPQTFASYVLYLQLPPHQIDVNVHPAKHEVRFHQARQIHDLVFKAITNSLGNTGNSAVVNELSQSPQHNYIQALSAELTPQRQSSYSGAGTLGYKSNKPNRGQINASNEFYSSLNAGKANDGGTVDELDATAANTSNSFVMGIGNCLYSEPYLVFGEYGSLNVMDIELLITKLIVLRLTRSSLPQPLLMPVSIENASHIKQAQLDEFNQVHLIISASHRKLILKQVPSELRQLPWASIFAKLDIANISDEQALTSTLALNIAKAWLNTLTVSESMLKGWMAEIGQGELSNLIEKHAKVLHLTTWMNDE